MGSNINQSRLRKGRQDLLELGLISQVLPTKENIILDREMYLPLSPELMWQDNIERLDGIITLKGIEQRSELVYELQAEYKKNFGNYGILIDHGNITVFHSSLWLLYFLAYNIMGNNSIEMMLGDLDAFDDPYIKYYENMLKSGLRMKVISDPASSLETQRIINIKKIMTLYSGQIDVRISPLSHGTSRVMIYNNMAIDSKWLGESTSSLSYISTIYLGRDMIEDLRNDFDTTFALCRNVDLKIE